MAGKNLNLGLVSTDLNSGHPHFWAAIFNGYDPEYMEYCPSPSVRAVLSAKKFPEDCIRTAKISHVWTDDFAFSNNLAKACNIKTVVSDLFDMVGCVDGILLAGCAHNRHYEMSKIFLDAGLPVFIDKPFALTVRDAGKIFSLEKYSNQVFTCSAYRYAYELVVAKKELDQLGIIQYVNAWISNTWEKYAIHIIEPVLELLPQKLDLLATSVQATQNVSSVTVDFNQNMTATFSTLGSLESRPTINIFGSRGFKQIVFEDVVGASKSSLEAFVEVIKGNQQAPSRQSVFQVIEIIQAGLPDYDSMQPSFTIQKNLNFR